MACMCSNRSCDSCPCCWCHDSRLDVTDKKYLEAADVVAQVDVAREELLDDYENVLRGEGRS
jgi:hypothetical protein